MRFMTVFTGIFFVAAPALAAERSVTFYLDGARVDEVHRAVRGYLEVPLPPGMQPNSLRIRPVGTDEIVRVEIAPRRTGQRGGKDVARLAEKKERLEARLKALEVKEEIFRAAARSQSGKAPRRSKTNPEPLESIRRGTEYALGQLEEVFRSRRVAEKELQEVEKRLAGTLKGGAAGESLARVRLKGNEGKVRLSYLLGEPGWKPRYDFRLSDGQVAVSQRAFLPAVPKGAEIFVLPAPLSRGAAGLRSTSVKGETAVASYRFAVDREELREVPVSTLKFLFKNNSPDVLPPGEATCYRQGEYLGTVAFPGVQPGEALEVVCGK
jgi:hypothetical protein